MSLLSYSTVLQSLHCMIEFCFFGLFVFSCLFASIKIPEALTRVRSRHCISLQRFLEHSAEEQSLRGKGLNLPQTLADCLPMPETITVLQGSTGHPVIRSHVRPFLHFLVKSPRRNPILEVCIFLVLKYWLKFPIYQSLNLQ